MSNAGLEEGLDDYRYKLTYQMPSPTAGLGALYESATSFGSLKVQENPFKHP